MEDHKDDARLPLVVGIAADCALTAKAAQMAEEPVAKILADVRGLYRAMPLLLLVQAPATLRGFAQRLRETLDAELVDLEDHLAPALGSAAAAATNLGGDSQEDATRRAAFLADHCHLVIAISDSREMPPDALVARIIQFRLQGIPDRHTGRPLQLDNFGLGSVHHIVAGKNDRAAAANAPMSTCLRPQVETPAGDEELDDATAWDHLDRFNGDVVRRLRRPARVPLPPPRQPCASPPGHSWLGDRFAVADALAIQFQKATHATAFGLLMLGLLAALAFQLSGLLPRATLVYPASLVLAYGWYLWAYWRRYEHRFHDYRALAEGLRVQMYWSAAGITACAADYYLRRQRSEIEWIRQALRVWTLTGRMAATAPSSDAARRNDLQQVCEQWVDDQWKYYSRTSLRHQSIGTWLNNAGKGFFALGLLLVGAKPLFPNSAAFTAAIGLAPAVAALLYMYAHTRAFLEQGRQYDRMSQLFGNARRRLRQVLEEGDVEAFRRLLLELGKEALRENGDWVLLHRERPITFGSAHSWLLAGSWIFGVCFRRRRKDLSARDSAASL
jgi:hypothetical protein